MSWLSDRRERKLHNEYDYECRYWFGDNSGSSFAAERCAICRPGTPLVKFPDMEFRVSVFGDNEIRSLTLTPIRTLELEPRLGEEVTITMRVTAIQREEREEEE